MLCVCVVFVVPASLLSVCGVLVALCVSGSGGAWPPPATRRGSESDEGGEGRRRREGAAPSEPHDPLLTAPRRMPVSPDRRSEAKRTADNNMDDEHTTHAAAAVGTAAEPTPTAPVTAAPAPAAFSSAFFAAAAAADTATAAAAMSPGLAAAAAGGAAPVPVPVPVSQLSTRSPAFTPAVAVAAARPNPKAPAFTPKAATAFNLKTAAFNPHAPSFAPPTAQPTALPQHTLRAVGSMSFQSTAAAGHIPFVAPTAPPSRPAYSTQHTLTPSFAAYPAPAATHPYGLAPCAPVFPAAPAAPAAPSLMMNQFGQWVPAYPAAYSAPPPPPPLPSFRPQPTLVPPPPVILSIKPLQQQPLQQPQQHSQQQPPKHAKQRKGGAQGQAQPPLPIPQQQLHVPVFGASLPSSAAAAAAALSVAPAESLSKNAQRKLAKQQQRQEQKLHKQQHKQQTHTQLDSATPSSSAPSIVAPVPEPAAASASTARVRPLTARTPPMLRNPVSAASAALTTAGAAATAAAAPVPAVAPARRSAPATVAAVSAAASVPSASMTLVGYLGSPRSSHGMHAAAKRSMAELVNALCGRDVFERAHAAQQDGHSQPRGGERRIPAQLGSSPTADSKTPIRLTEFEADAAEWLLHGSELPARAPPPSSSPSPSSAPSSLDAPLGLSIVSEDVTLPVSQFAQIRTAVDARNRLVHLCVAEPVDAPGTAEAGLRLGFDAPLGFDRVDWMEELARLPLSVLQSMSQSEFDRWLVAGTSQQLRSALVLFCACHHIVLAHPAPQLQMDWIHALRLLAALKSRLIAPNAKDGDAAAAATAADAAAMYRSLLSSLSLIDPEIALLSRHSSGLPLCFTPSLSFLVQTPSFLLGRAGGDDRQLVHFTDSFRAQLSSICAHFGLTAANAATDDVSPAACAAMLRFTPAAPAEASNGSLSTSRFYKPSQRQLKAASGDDKITAVAAAAADDSDASAPPHLHVPPLFFLHTQQPVISVDFAALFGDSDEHEEPAKDGAAGAEPASLGSLRSTLERSIFVARAHIDSLHASLPRDGLPSLLSAPRQLRCLQVVHSWIVDRSSAFASALDSTLLHSLHTDFQFSASRCDHAAAVAKNIYLNAQQSAANARAAAHTTIARSPQHTSSAAGQDQPASAQRTATQFYSAQAHRQRLETVVRLFHNLAGAGTEDAAPSSAVQCAAPLSPTRAVGPAVSAFEAALRRDLESYWLQSHRGCDATSVFGHACVLPHGHAAQSLDAIAASSWPVEHAAVAHSLRLSCHCGTALMKLSKEPFDLAALRVALTDRCCALAEPIGRQVFSGCGVDGRNGWNVVRPPAGYNPATGFAALPGFYVKAARTAFLPTIRMMLPDTHCDRLIDFHAGLEFECPLGHRWIQPDSDDESKDVSSSPTSASGVGPVCAGFPRRDTFLFLPCLICRYLRHLQQKAASDSAADARQKRLHAEEKRGRAMLQQQREENKDDPERFASVAGSFASPTVPSSSVRSHDRYAQLRRIWVATPASPLLSLDAHIKSTRPPTHNSAGSATAQHAQAALTGATTDTLLHMDRLTLLRGESTGSFAAPASSTPTTASGAPIISRFGVRPTPAGSSSASLAPSLVHSHDSELSSGPDNFAPLSGAGMPAGSPRPTLPPSSFICIEVPFVLERQGQCLSTLESKHCILQSHVLTPV